MEMNLSYDERVAVDSSTWTHGMHET